VFGYDWTVSFDMEKSDGSYEYLTLSVPKINSHDSWKLPNQIGNWECLLVRWDSDLRGYYNSSSMSLHCHSKENEKVKLLSKIRCNNTDRKTNELSVLYPKTIKNKKNTTFPNTIISIKCKFE